MSRVGQKPISVPSGVKIAIHETRVEVEGPKGKLVAPVPRGIKIEQGESELRAVLENDAKELKPLWGLARSLLANAVLGVTQGFAKELEIVGIGYRAALEGNKVVFSLGYSHPIEMEIPAGITIDIEKQTRLKVSGADKQLVGQVAANIKQYRKPDPYKQKGIRYVGEILKKKAGKTGA